MISNYENPVQWRQSFTAVKPIAQVAATTSGNTTFTVNTVVDGSAWDLSNVKQGDILEVIDSVSSEMFMGRVQSVDDGNDTITLQGSGGWYRGEISGRGLAELKPSDGSPVIVHRLDKCVKITIDAITSNPADVYLGFDNTVTVAGGANPGQPISNNPSYAHFRLELETGLDRYLDLKRMYIVAAAASEVTCIAQ
jgi:hypothetical protein